MQTSGEAENLLRLGNHARATVWRRSQVAVSPLLVALALIGCGKVSVMGHGAAVKLPDGSDTIDAELKVHNVLVEPRGDQVAVVLSFAVRNTGKREIVLPEYDQARLRDAEDRDFKGARSQLSKDTGGSGTTKGMLRAEPGGSVENWVSFSVPRDAFKGQVRFGFVPYFRRHGESLHGSTLIYDPAGSAYSFDAPGKFEEPVWR